MSPDAVTNLSQTKPWKTATFAELLPAHVYSCVDARHVTQDLQREPWTTHTSSSPSWPILVGAKTSNTPSWTTTAQVLPNGAQPLKLLALPLRPRPQASNCAVFSGKQGTEVGSCLSAFWRATKGSCFWGRESPNISLTFVARNADAHQPPNLEHGKVHKLQGVFNLNGVFFSCFHTDAASCRRCYGILRKWAVICRWRPAYETQCGQWLPNPMHKLSMWAIMRRNQRKRLFHSSWCSDS